MSISNINAAPYNTIQYISGVPILSISYINGVQTTIAPPSQYLLIGGSFTTYNAPSLGGIAKIDSTGSLDPSFNMGTGFSAGYPYFFIQQPDGKYLVGGFNLTSYSGSSINRVIRLNQNGSVDTTFIQGTGANNSLYDAKSYSDNSNIIVGNFLTYSGSTVNGLVKTTPSGSRDTSFNIGFGFQNSGTGPAQAVVVQSDGKAIIGVQSNQYSSSNNSLCRTDLSGSYNAGPETTFNYGVGTGIGGFIYTAVTQSDGKIILGGTFTTYSGSSVNRIVRINPNGTRDTSFNVGLGFPTDVNEIQIQPDGKIIAVGAFTTYSGSSSNVIVRINPDGTRDTSFNVGTGFSAAMNRIRIQPDGKILVGGQATTYSGSTINFLTRLTNSGSIDPTFNTGTGFSAGGAVYGLAIQPDGKIVAGGGFTTYSGSSTNTTRIIRINPSGSQDTSFVTGAGFTNIVYNLALEPTTNKIVVVGGFTGYSGSSGTNVTRIVRLNPNGTLDTSLVSGTGIQSFATPISHLSVESDGKIYVGASFNTYSGSTVNNFVRINPSGSIDPTFPLQLPASRAGFSTTVRSLFISSSNIYFFGDFNGFRANASGLIRLNTDGTQDTTFATGNNLSSGGNPYNLLLQNDGKILVMGTALNPYSGSSVSPYIFRINLDGTHDTTFSTAAGGPNGQVISAATESNGKIVLVGNFTTYDGVTTNRIVRITNSGSRDASFNVGTGFDAFSNSNKNGQVIVTPNNDVYVAGTFTTYSGSTVNRIVKILPSGAIDTTFVTSASSSFGNQIGLNNASTVLIQSGSSVIISGQFVTYESPLISRGVMVDSTGTVSSSFNIGTGFSTTIRTWATQSDGKILAGGDFTTYSGSSTNTTRIIRLNRNGTQDTSFVTGVGFNSTVTDIRVQSDGKIIAAGAFTTYSGSSTSGIVRLNISGTRDATFNVGTGATDVKQCRIQSDEKIVVVGGFTVYSGSTSNRLVRINTNGTRDTSFDIGTGFNNTVESVVIQSDGKIIPTGNFTTYSGSSISRILRLNISGTRDTTFNVGTGLAGSGFAVALQSDGKIVCSTLTQTTYSGSTARSILRINTDGTLDNTFGFYPPAIGFSSTSNTPNSLAIANDGKIYWGNAFTTYSGSFRPNRIVRLNSNGSVDDTFNQAYPNFVNGTGKGTNGTIHAVLLL